jgi:hypothetical protein
LIDDKTVISNFRKKKESLSVITEEQVANKPQQVVKSDDDDFEIVQNDIEDWEIL